MARTERLLILDRNRYRALLTERAVSEVMSEAIVTRLKTDAEATRELMDSAYDVAIINLDHVERPIETVRLARSRWPDIKLFVIGRPETSKRIVGSIEPLVDLFVSRPSGQQRFEHAHRCIPLA